MKPIIGPGTMYVYMWRTREDAALDHWGNGKWPLPGRRRPGEWAGGVDVWCRRGFGSTHVVRTESDLIENAGPQLYTVRYRPSWRGGGEGQLLARVDRWHEGTAAALVRDYSRHVLPRVNAMEDRERAREHRRLISAAVDWATVSVRRPEGVDPSWLARRRTIVDGYLRYMWYDWFDLLEQIAEYMQDIVANDLPEGIERDVARAEERGWQIERLRAYLCGEVKARRPPMAEIRAADVRALYDRLGATDGGPSGYTPAEFKRLFGGPE